VDVGTVSRVGVAPTQQVGVAGTDLEKKRLQSPSAAWIPRLELSQSARPLHSIESSALLIT